MEINLESNKYVNLYSITGIDVGTKLIVANLGSTSVRLFSTVDQPTIEKDHYLLRANSLAVSNEEKDLGAWALCVGGGSIDIKVA